MVEPITAQQAYPFPKRVGGHPNFVALLERLYDEHSKKRAEAIALGQPDPGGLTVVSWDTSHASPIIKEALANPDAAGRTAMSVLAAHRAVYVDEGGPFKTRMLAQYMGGGISDQELPREIAASYSLAIPELRDRINQSYADVWQVAKQQGVSLFYPESETVTAGDWSFKPSMGGAILGSLWNLGGTACSGVFQEPFKQWLSKEALDRIEADGLKFYAWRAGIPMNQMAADAANERIAGHNAFIHYGAGHGVLYGMINGEKVGITMLTSQTVPFNTKRPELHLGSYVYFAAEDKVVKVPIDPKEREAFIAALANPQVVTNIAADTPEKQQACVAALSTDQSVRILGNRLSWVLRGSGAPIEPGGEIDMVAGREMVAALKEKIENPAFTGGIFVAALARFSPDFRLSEDDGRERAEAGLTTEGREGHGVLLGAGTKAGPKTSGRTF